MQIKLPQDVFIKQNKFWQWDKTYDLADPVHKTHIDTLQMQ